MRILSKTQQDMLAIRAQAGDQAAVQEILDYCKPDILAEIKKKHCNQADAEDLLQVANLAILEHAIHNYRPSEGMQLRFYCAWWVRTALHRFFNTQSSIVVTNVHTHNQPDEALPPENSPELMLHYTPEDIAIAHETIRQTRMAIQMVEPRVIRSRAKYDIDHVVDSIIHDRLMCHETLPLTMIAKSANISTEAVRQIEEDVVISLCRNLRKIRRTP